MKRIFFWVMLISAPFALFSQTPAADAPARAQEHKWIEEGFTALSSRLKSIEENQDSLRQRQGKIMESIQNLTKDLEDLRRAQSAINPNAVTQEQLKALAADVQLIDDKRMKDSELVKKMLKDLQQDILAPLPGIAKATTSTKLPPPTSGEFYEYVVKPTDRSLSDIILHRNAELKASGLAPITLVEVKAANPDLDPNRIFPGKRIRLPQPAKK